MTYSKIPKRVRAMFSKYNTLNRLPAHIEATILKKYVNQLMRDFLQEYADKTRAILAEMHPSKITVQEYNNDFYRKQLEDYARLAHDVGCDPTEFEVSKAVELSFHSVVDHVPAARPWAPTVKVNGKSYIPHLYAVAEEPIKNYLKLARLTITQTLEAFILNRMEDGWIPVTTKEHNTMEKISFKQARNVDLDVLENVIDREFSRGIVMVKEVEDNQNAGTWYVQLCHLQSTRLAFADDLREELTATVESMTHVLIDGIAVPHAEYAVKKWTLATLMEKITNAEQRRVLMQRYGFDKLLETCESETIDIDNATTHVADETAPSITRALIAMKTDKHHQYRIVVGTDGSTGRVYYMPATDPNGRHCESLEEWDRRVGQPKRLYAQA